MFGCAGVSGHRADERSNPRRLFRPHLTAAPPPFAPQVSPHRAVVERHCVVCERGGSHHRAAAGVVRVSD